MSDPLLSLIMIVKNEEKRLPRCLEAAKACHAELIMTDTGSTDRTVEIAKSFGASVLSFPWNGNEADARNVSLRAATGRWIFWVDADETISPELAASLRSKLPSIDANPSFHSGSITMENRYQDGAGTSLTRLLRLARRRSDLRFEGAIHPQLNFQREIATFEGILHHDGYAWTPEERKRKAEHMRSHLEPLCRDEKPPLNRWCEYLSTLLIGDDRREFFRLWSKAPLYTPEERLRGPFAHYWSDNLSNLFQFFSRQNDFTTALPYAIEMRAFQPHHPGALFYLLQNAVAQKNWREVASLSNEFLTVAIAPQEFYTTLYPDRQIPPARAWGWLARNLLSPTSPLIIPDWMTSPRLLPSLLSAVVSAEGKIEHPDKYWKALASATWELHQKTFVPARRIPLCDAAAKDQPSSSMILLWALLVKIEALGLAGEIRAMLNNLQTVLETYPDFQWLAFSAEKTRPETPFRIQWCYEHGLHQ